MKAHVVSDIGLVREINEDDYIFTPPNLFVVADGMGGHLAGEIASKQAMTVMKDCFLQNPDSESASMLLVQSILKANEEIYQLAISNPEYTGMGTTITATYMDRNSLHWAHVGDSRLYVITQSGLTQITSDHSFVGELLRNASITPDEARKHPQRNLLTRAIGVDNHVEIDHGSIQLGVGDSILLCTDGLTNMVTDEVIYELIQKNAANPVLVVEELVNQAKANGGHDNITVIWVADL